MASQSSILKEVYEKRKRKMATDGQVDTNDNNRVPPFLKGRRSPNGGKAKEQERQAMSDAASRRLAKMRGGKKPEGK